MNSLINNNFFMLCLSSIIVLSIYNIDIEYIEKIKKYINNENKKRPYNIRKKEEKKRKFEYYQYNVQDNVDVNEICLLCGFISSNKVGLSIDDNEDDNILNIYNCGCNSLL
jgi:hypothetical protein